jgi:hypothetical protein
MEEFFEKSLFLNYWSKKDWFSTHLSVSAILDFFVKILTESYFSESPIHSFSGSQEKIVNQGITEMWSWINFVFSLYLMDHGRWIAFQITKNGVWIQRNIISKWNQEFSAMLTLWRSQSGRSRCAVDVD